jgi:hypothetical protein
MNLWSKGVTGGLQYFNTKLHRRVNIEQKTPDYYALRDLVKDVREGYAEALIQTVYEAWDGETPDAEALFNFVWETYFEKDRYRESSHNEARTRKDSFEPVLNDSATYGCELIESAFMFDLLVQSYKYENADLIQTMHRMFLPVFQGGDNFNYTNQVMNELCGLQATLTETQAWISEHNRTINPSGKAGCAYPSDQGQEHKNKVYKGQLGPMRSQQNREYQEAIAITCESVANTTKNLRRELGITRGDSV